MLRSQPYDALEASVLIRRSVALVFFVWAMSAVSTSASPILSIDPASTTVNAGDTFTLNIDIADVVDLFTYNFDLAFDQNILAFQSIVEGPFPQNAESTFFIAGQELTPGTVSFTGNTVLGPTGVSGSGTLAIATFLAIMAGTTSITFPDQLFIDSNFDQISFDAINSGSVQVNGVTSAVPEEPSTMILLASALAFAACRCFTRAS